MEEKKFDIDQMMIDEWRQLGFYYTQISTDERKQWEFYGSQQGLKNLVAALASYVNNPHKAGLSEHEHYGPYSYLKIMTWHKPTVTEQYIAGTIRDLDYLKTIITDKLSRARAGQTFDVNDLYGVDNTFGMTFLVMPDDFDPASTDKIVK